MLIATFLMLNIVLAIIIDAYSHVKASMHNAPTINGEIFSVSREWTRMLLNRLLGKHWKVREGGGGKGTHPARAREHATATRHTRAAHAHAAWGGDRRAPLLHTRVCVCGGVRALLAPND